MDNQKKLQTLEFLRSKLEALQKNPNAQFIEGYSRSEILYLTRAVTGIAELENIEAVLSQVDAQALEEADIRLRVLEQAKQNKIDFPITQEIEQNLSSTQQAFEIKDPQERKQFITENLPQLKLDFSFPEIPAPVREKVSLAKEGVKQELTSRFSPQTQKFAQSALKKLSKIPGVKKLGRAGAKLLAKLGIEGVISAGTLMAIELGYQALKLLKNLPSKLKRMFSRSVNSNTLAAIGTVSFFLFPIAPLTALASGGILIGSSYLAGGSAAVSAGVGAVFGGFMSIFTAAIAVTITPIIISLIVIPLMLAFIIFIITSGAYMVPPGTSVVSLNGPGGLYALCWPIHGTSITQGPNIGRHLTSPNGTAIDIGAARGTPVYATHDGTATAYDYGVSGYGIYVVIESKVSEFDRTIYAHLLSTSFSGTMEVKAGDLIGYVNNTGHSSGDHLHYEVISTTLTILDIVPSTYPDVTSGCFADQAGGGNSIAKTGSSLPAANSTGSSLQTSVNICKSNGGACTTSSLCPTECQISTYDSSCISGSVCCDTACAATKNNTKTQTYSCDLSGGRCLPQDDCESEKIVPNGGVWNCSEGLKCCEPKSSGIPVG